MKKITFLTLGVACMMGVSAATTVKITEASPGAPALTTETMLKYDCFIISGETLAKAMGKVPETSLAGVNEIAAYLNLDFTANYETLLTDAYGMQRNANWRDFRSSGQREFGESFGLVVYNPVDGTRTGVEDITYFRVFNFDNRNMVRDSASNSGYWSGWTSASAAPEPTGGLMLLLGVASLALRRKRNVS